jgi:acyl-CoA thioesterase
VDYTAAEMSLGLRVPLPDPENALPWAHQMNLDKLSDTTFRSTMGTLSGGYATKNGKQRPRAFGGHVFAQSAYAASKTIDKGFIIHV